LSVSLCFHSRRNTVPYLDNNVNTDYTKLVNLENKLADLERRLAITNGLLLGRQVVTATKTGSTETKVVTIPDSKQAYQIDSLQRELIKLRSQSQNNVQQPVLKPVIEAGFPPVNNIKEVVVVKEPKPSDKIVSGNQIDCIITYPINQSDLSDMQRNLISSQILNVINKGGSNFVLLEAYTDSSGDPIYNKKLSDLRINKVINFLIANGIAKETILTKNFGEEKAQENINPEERKIVFKIINDGK